MEPQSPGITPLRDLTLVAINGVLTKIRQRLDMLDRKSVQSPVTADQLLALQKQVSALQMGAKTTTVVQQATTAPTPPPATAASIPEVDTDPETPAAGEAWVLRTLVNPAGTLQGFAGGFPLVIAEDQNRFDLSISTTDGTRRVQIT